MGIIAPYGYNVTTILSIDPSSNFTGIAVFKVDNYSGSILSIEADTIAVGKLVYDPGISEELHTERIIKMLKLQNKFFQLLTEVQPQIIVSEGSFYNPMMPMAFGSLTEVISILHRTCIDYDKEMPFVTLSPKTIKSAISSLKTTDKGKDIIKDSIKNIPEVYDLVSNFIDKLDNHGIDAIAVGYAFLKNYGEE